MTFYGWASRVRQGWADRRDAKRAAWRDDARAQAEAFLRSQGDALGRPGPASNGRPVVLIYSVLGNAYVMHMEGFLARGLQEKGYRPVLLTVYPVKFLSDAIHWQVYGLTDILYLQDFMDVAPGPEAHAVVRAAAAARSVDDYKGIVFGATAVGLHALASVGDVTRSSEMKVDTRFTSAMGDLIARSCRTVAAVRRVLDRVKPVKVLAVEKGSTGTCEFFYEALHRGIDFVQWCSCHEPNAIMLKRYSKSNVRHHPFSVSEKTWRRALDAGEDHEAEVLQAFRDGYINGSWFRYKNLATNKALLGKADLLARLGLSADKKVAIIFSHILNDANFFYGEDLFSGGFPEWLVKTVEAASRNPRVHWLLKLHPANLYRRANAGVTGEYGEILAIRKALGEVPKNIVVIPADIDINPYSFFGIADYGVTVRGTVGAELPCFGIPVLTAGTGRYSGRGFTIDSSTAAEYLEKIERIHEIPSLSAEERRRALLHARLFFKTRPAKYDTLALDVFPFPAGHPWHWALDGVDPHWRENRQLRNIVAFIADSRDEDYLADIDYTTEQRAAALVAEPAGRTL